MAKIDKVLLEMYTSIVENDKEDILAGLEVVEQEKVKRQKELAIAYKNAAEALDRLEETLYHLTNEAETDTYLSWTDLKDMLTPVIHTHKSSQLRAMLENIDTMEFYINENG